MISNRGALSTTPAREIALACLEAGIEAAHPKAVIREKTALNDDLLRIGNSRYDLSEYDEIVVLGGGKASAQVAAALESILGERIDRGAVVTNDPAETTRIEMLPGEHPIPSKQGVESTKRVLELADSADENALILAAITGGASALLPAPADGVSLADMQTVTRTLLDSGATIDEINAVRKHCSALKGGQLARTAAPATVVGLLFSDVVGDDPGIIGSGPTAPDETTFGDALAVLDRYGVETDTGSAIRTRFERGAAGNFPETPDAGDAVFERATTHVLASNFTALRAARETANRRGYDAMILSSRVRGEARESATTHVAIAEEILETGNPISPPAVLLSGGETTVSVRGEGSGGPNLEFALGARLELAEGVTVASVDTDGKDGSTDAAGALVDRNTSRDGGQEALQENDSYRFLESVGALVETGATGTNVNDLRILVVE
ncbi:glycerate kinase [Haladaptatus pallidirubidus]|uniref:Glycerate kinase n=1 Tax=Haladaptatus pallidirubidus TaxID=1008152 RepID=A0AAV3UA83_9EURY|nr:glycerate kinase [Haladaptatus pallidirubidus]